MHILYLSSLGGGLDTNVRVLGPALVRAGHSVSVLYVHFAGASIPDVRIDGCAVHHATMGAWHYYVSRATFGRTALPMLVRAFEYDAAVTQAVMAIHKRRALDLIEIPEFFSPGRIVEKIPTVVRLHSAAWMCRAMYNEPALASDGVERWLEARTLGRVAGISSPSRFVADAIRAQCRVRQPIEIIPYPIDTTRFTPGSARAHPPMILFVGRVEKRKGADVLLRAAMRVLEQHPHSEFVFIGHVSDDLKGHAGREIRVHPRSSASDIRFLGVLPREEIIAWYQRAALFVAPSLWDNSPNTIYEAMACGTPVVATRVGGIPELVDDGVTGLLVPPGDERALADAIIALLSDDKRREEMARRGREKAVAVYSLSTVTATTVDSYTRTLRAEHPKHS